MLLKHAVKNGLDSDDLCKTAGIDPTVFKDIEARISVGQFLSIWEHVDKKAGSRNFGLDFGRELVLHYHSGHISYVKIPKFILVLGIGTN